MSVADEFPDMHTDPYDGFLHRTLDEARQIAASQGRVVRSPGPRELFIDIDSSAQLDVYCQQVRAMPKGLVLRDSVTASPSGKAGHFHIVVTLSRDVKNMTERVMLQALLGSDPMRELLSWRRIEDGSEHDAISLFFEKPGWDAPQVAIPTENTELQAP